ncbi:MAG: hypothetical protein AB7T38_15180 [Nitrospirales bacterium]
MKEVERFTPTPGRTGMVPGLLVIAMWMGFLVACVPPKVQTQQAPQFDPPAIKSVAVVPFRILETPQWGSSPSRGGLRDPEEIRTQFRLPGTDQIDSSEGRKNLYVVPEIGAQRLTNMVMSALAGRPSLRVVGPPETSSFLKTEGSQASTSFSSLAKDVGSRFSVDGVLLGLVRTYRERDGSKLGARPAAVGFELYLVRPADGVVLWKGEYYEEQKPMTEDIVGFWEKGGGFVTVDELATFGVNKVMNQFPVGK